MHLQIDFSVETDCVQALAAVLGRLGNTAAARAIIAFKENHGDMKTGDCGLICAFGVGYSIGGAPVRMI